jgi:hypothetical protein
MFEITPKIIHGINRFTTQVQVLRINSERIIL